MKRNKALVVLSGGQDSTTCLFWALRHFEEVHALAFTYGQKHAQEVDIARTICQEQNVPFEAMDIPLIGQLGRNSLTDTSMEMDTEKPSDSPPNTFVPGRNLFFLSIAAVHAREKGIFDLITGVGQTDFSGYPDCRDAFIKSLNVTLNLAMDEQFCIHTPLMWLDKAQTWALADKLGVLDLIRLMDPKYIEVTGLFTPRGGISIFPYANYGRPGTKFEKLAEYRLQQHDL